MHEWETIEDGYRKRLRYVDRTTGLIVGYVLGSTCDPRSWWNAILDSPNESIGNYTTEGLAKQAVERAVVKRQAAKAEAAATELPERFIAFDVAHEQLEERVVFASVYEKVKEERDEAIRTRVPQDQYEVLSAELNLHKEHEHNLAESEKHWRSMAYKAIDQRGVALQRLSQVEKERGHLLEAIRDVDALRSERDALQAKLDAIICAVDVEKAKEIVLSYFPGAIAEARRDRWTIRISPQTTMGLGGTSDAAWVSFALGWASKKNAYNERAERAESQRDALQTKLDAILKLVEGGLPPLDERHRRCRFQYLELRAAIREAGKS